MAEITDTTLTVDEVIARIRRGEENPPRVKTAKPCAHPDICTCGQCREAK